MPHWQGRAQPACAQCLLPRCEPACFGVSAVNRQQGPPLMSRGVSIPWSCCWLWMQVAGAERIMHSIHGRPIAAVKLFSSIAAPFGSGGQANYAAANALLDAQASALQAQVLISILCAPTRTLTAASSASGLAGARHDSSLPQCACHTDSQLR